jgi:hypothetical protein
MPTLGQMPDKWLESVCAAIVCDVLGNGARWDCTDRDGTSNMRDFDIVFHDRYEALEVCAFTDPVAEASRAARKHDDVKPSMVLSRTWFVTAPVSAPIQGLLAAVEPALAVFEGRGRVGFEDVDHWRLKLEFGPDDELAKAASALTERRVTSAQSYAPAGDEEPTIHLFTPTGGVLNPEDINRAVEDRAWKDDNQQKLASADGAAARHLFVPIRMPATLTFAAATHGPPRTAPDLPGVITRAWASPCVPTLCGSSRVWRGRQRLSIRWSSRRRNAGELESSVACVADTQP